MNVKTTKTLGKLIALSLITSAALHATNGDNLISVGTKARGMGGVGIAMSHGAESGIANPALITSVESTEIGFGGTIFMPDIETEITGYGPAHTSDADLSLIPGVSIAHKVDNNWYVGIGMWGTAGMGTDYADIPMTQTDAANMHMVTNLQLMQFAVPMAYKTEGLSLAIAPVIQYGNLDIDFFNALTQTPTGAGVAQDFGFGFNLGVAYELDNGLTLGAMYKSAIEMDYDNQLTTATRDFPFTLPDGDTLEQPAEYGVGFAYEMGQHTFAFDYKKIKWSDAKGYKDFGWDDSDVYAFGYQYTENEWTIRLGYNYASSAVEELPLPVVVDQATGLAAAQASSANFFNLLGFPATQEQHYTVGASYQVTKSFSVDLAYVYAPSNEETFDISGLQNNLTTITTDHSESGLSFQLAYKF